ncbi:MAG: hypothetical protein QW491_09425 [Thermoproteota archaeon]
MNINEYNMHYRKHGLVKLRDIATLLESCQFPARFSEIKRRTGWREHKLIRLLRTLISMGLVEVKTEQKWKTYVTSESGLSVLKRLNNVLTDETYS